VRVVKLDKTRIISQYERDKFIPDIIFLLFGLTIAFAFSFVIFSFDFLFGSLFMSLFGYGIILYRIFKTPDLKRFYYQCETDERNNWE
jgi:hypothetical protein